MDGLSINLDEENQFDVDDLYQLKHSYSVMAVLRNYVTLGSSKRFALFSETQLGMGGSQSKVVNKGGDSVTGTYSTTTDFSIGVAPGIVAFINNYTAVEVSIGAVSYTHLDVYKRQIHVSASCTYRTYNPLRVRLRRYHRREHPYPDPDDATAPA